MSDETTDITEEITDEASEVVAEHLIEEPETFSREYVTSLREESAANRVKAKRADDLAAALFAERVRALGKVADPRDVPYDPDVLDDPAALAAHVDALLAERPHLAKRKSPGSIGQGVTSDAPTEMGLHGLLRQAIGG